MKILKNLFWVIKQIYVFDKKFIYVTVFSMISAGILPPFSTLISQSIVNSIQIGDSFKKLIFFTLLYFFIDLYEGLFFYYYEFFKTKYSLDFELYFNEILLNKASKLKLKSYEDSETYNMINMAQYKGNSSLLLYFEIFTSIFSSIIMILSYLTIILQFNIYIVLCIVVIPLIKYWISNNINIQNFVLRKNRTNDLRKAEYIRSSLTYESFFKELKIYDLGKYFLEKYKKYKNNFNREDIKLKKKEVYQLSCISVVEGLIDCGLFTYIVFCGYCGKILIGNVLTYIQTIVQIKMQISNVLKTLSNMNRESLFVDQLINFLNLEEEVNTGHTTINVIKKISVRNLYYKYPKNQKYVLKNINFDLNSGETVAIVGINGSGKSTLIKILLGFYDDYEGDIFINDINVKMLDKDNWRQKISALFQDFVKYEGTFRENISYGNLELLNLDEELYQITKDFGVYSLIKESKNELDCPIGFLFDNGKQISLGEWQRVALCRTFFKQSDVFFLDEPNASLDSIAEYKILQYCKKSFSGKIGVLIVHKFGNFAKDIDKIIVLNKGRSTGIGTHNELIKNNETYRALYMMQFKGNLES